MPTLLSINNYHYHRGGAETVYLEHNRLFEQAGWDVACFSMKHPKNLPSVWERFFVDELEFGAEYSVMGRMVRAGKAIYSFEARRKLGELLALTKPAIAHAHNIYHHISPSILGVLRSRDVPVVLTLHDLKIACPAYTMLREGRICEACRGGRIYNVLRNRCVKSSTALSAVVFVESALHRLLGSYRDNVGKFIVPSAFYIDKFVEWGFERSLFRHVPNFVDATRFEPTPASGRSFLYFGRLSPEKGLTTLVRAAARARVPLRIVGTGPQEPELRRVAQETGAEVSFLGYLSGAPLHDAIRQARAVVLPSEWFENAPMTVLESYALARPVIGADIGGIPELIRDNETGVRFRSGDIDSLADALSKVAGLSDATLHAWGNTARNWIERNFSTAVYRERIQQVYAELNPRIHCDPRNGHDS